MNQNSIKNKFGLVNILTDEEKSSYRAFAQRVHGLSHADLFKLHIGQADMLTSEMKDIVAWEIKMREIDIMKKNNIKMEDRFSVDNVHNEFGYLYERDPEFVMTKKDMEYAINERHRLEEMSDSLLERSKQIINNTPVVISKNNLHNMNGGGVNVLAKNYIVEDSNGEQVLIDNEKIQEHFRKMYVKRMSEITGIDYTAYDQSKDLDLSQYSDGNFEKYDLEGKPLNMGPQTQINSDDYEDD